MLPDLPPLSLADIGHRVNIGLLVWLLLALVSVVAALRSFTRRAR